MINHVFTLEKGSRDGVVVRALASHQCGPGSIPGPDAVSGLSLCWFSSLLRGFFSGFSGFPPSPKTNIEYAKPNVAIFNIDIFIQFNPYSFNLIFIFIQFNFHIHSI